MWLLLCAIHQPGPLLGMQKPEEDSFLFASVLHTPHQSSWKGQTMSSVLGEAGEEGKSEDSKPYSPVWRPRSHAGFNTPWTTSLGAATPNTQGETKQHQANQPTSQRTHPAEKFGKDRCNDLRFLRTLFKPQLCFKSNCSNHSEIFLFPLGCKLGKSLICSLTHLDTCSVLGLTTAPGV